MTEQRAPGDIFSAVSAGYAAFRPRYPRELFEFVAGAAPRRDRAWDCGAGSGQATIDLADWFDRVVATDVSTQQVARGPESPTIDWVVSTAEAPPLRARTIDAITVAQALHWFDHERFFLEVRRVASPGAVLVAWTYEAGRMDGDIGAALHRFTFETMGSYWPPQRRHVDTAYRTIPFPFERLPAPELRLVDEWPLARLVGFMRTWSAVAQYRKTRADDPVAAVERELAALWGEVDTPPTDRVADGATCRPRIPGMSVTTQDGAERPVAGDSAANPTLRDLQRELGELLPTSAAEETDSSMMTLQVESSVMEPPRLVSAVILEGTVMRPHRITEPSEATFGAFLDGTQSSQIVRHVQGVPIVRGTVAAVIRLRRNRRLTTWRHVGRTRVYAPMGLLPDECQTALRKLPAHVVDTTVVDGNEVIEHPYAVRNAAIHYVQRHREHAEQDLAKQWCATMNEALFIDGGVSANERMANDACIVGVVKSHRTLYATGDALRVILRLNARERSSVFRITSPRRNVVASWYLRLRDPRGHDPMWGLVRVEIPDPAMERGIGARADEISRWILAEVSPIALPDARWDKMVYGIRDCEEWLRAIG